MMQHIVNAQECLWIAADALDALRDNPASPLATEDIHLFAGRIWVITMALDRLAHYSRRRGEIRCRADPSLCKAARSHADSDLVTVAIDEAVTEFYRVHETARDEQARRIAKGLRFFATNLSDDLRASIYQASGRIAIAPVARRVCRPRFFTTSSRKEHS